MKQKVGLMQFVAAALYFSVAGVSFGAQSAAATSSLKLNLQTNSAGETLVQLGSNPAVPLAEASKVLKADGTKLSLLPQEAAVTITSAQFAGWSASVPPKQVVSVSFDYAKRTLRAESSEENLQPVRLNFSDGANVMMPPKAQGRLELMDDGTYAFFGTGSMSGMTADGNPVRFGNVFPPLFGGKLITPPADNPNARFSRASPVTPLILMGQFETGISARVGNETFPLEPGKPREIRAANGSIVSLTMNAQTRAVDYTVQRGLFRISVGGVSCWKSLATSGQSAAMQWDPNGYLMQIKNNNPQEALLVNLNPTLNVAVGSSATFQYGRTGDCSTFMGSGHGGEVVMYNARTDQYVRLDDGNMNIVLGGPDTAPGPQIPRTPIRLRWQTDDQVAFSALSESITVAAGGHEVFHADPATQLDVTYGDKDNLNLRVETGAVAITPEFAPKITIEFIEATALKWGFDRALGILRVASDSRNLSPIAVRTAAGYYPRIPPGSRLTFVITDSTFTDDEEGMLIFSELAGAGTLPRGLTPVRTLPTGRGDGPLLGGVKPLIDASRIEQPPVTTFE